MPLEAINRVETVNGVLKGKTALITGSTSGLGLAMAEAVAELGCNVVLHGLEERAPVGIDCAALGKRLGVEVHYVSQDLADVSGVAQMMTDAVERFGGIDVLVNNAVAPREFASIQAFAVKDWNRSLAVNVSAAFHTVRLALPEMKRKRWGRIVNMTSVYGMRGTVERIDYVTTKAAILGLTRGIAMETVHDGITCNALCPATVLTPGIEERIQRLMNQSALDRTTAERKFLEGKQPTGEFVKANDVGAMLAFLCGPHASAITGAVLPLDGGWLAS